MLEKQLRLLKVINKALKPFSTLIGALVVIIGGVWSVYTILFTQQDLSVFIQQEQVNFPVNINDRYRNVYNYIADSCKDSSVAMDTKATYEYLQNTGDFWVISLKNETKKSLKNLTIIIKDVNALGSWAVNTDFLLQTQKEKLINNFQFDTANRIIALKDVEILPSHQELKLYLWGKLPSLNLDENLIVTYDGGEGHIGHRYEAFGFRAFLCANLY